MTITASLLMQVHHLWEYVGYQNKLCKFHEYKQHIKIKDWIKIMIFNEMDIFETQIT